MLLMMQAYWPARPQVASLSAETGHGRPRGL